MRIEVDAAGVAGVEAGPDSASGRNWFSGLGAAQIAKRRPQAPVERRRAKRPVQHVEAQAGQMQNSCLVAVDRGRAAAGGGAGKGLEALQRERGNKAVIRVGKRDVALHLRTDRLP